MTVMRLEEVKRHPVSPNHPTAMGQVTAPDNAMSREQAWTQAVWEELDDYRSQLRTLNSVPPEEVFALLSAITARCAELRVQTWRSESKRLAALRSHELDPLIEEADRQFRFHSRRQSVRQMEWDATKLLT